MKTHLFISVILISFLISLSGNANAKNRPNSNEITLNATFTNSSDIENDLEIENWMTNEYFWDKQELNSLLTETEVKEDLEIKDWMSSDIFFKIGKQPENDENSDTLSVQNWMTDNKLWRL